MTTAWRGDYWTATEKAAALLAWHCGYGSGFGQICLSHSDGTFAAFPAVAQKLAAAGWHP